MNNIDQRIVEMQFDNSKFEPQAQQSINTLDRLKNAMNFDGTNKGFSNMSATTQSLGQMNDAVNAIVQNFSTMGIIGATVIQRLTNSVISFVSGTLTKLSQGGIQRAANLEQARFQFKAMISQDIKDMEKVGKQVEKYMGSGGPIQNAVKGTAYGLDEAAKVGSQLMASGIKDTQEMEKQLTAIAGVAAMTGSSYSDVGEIFTTVASNGKLMTQQVRQLSFRGLNASATLAKYLTKVGDQGKVTESQVNEMVTKGKIDFKTFAAAMSWAFGDSAKKANETFSGAMSNVNAALSRIGAEFWLPFRESMRKTLVTLIPVIDSIHELLTPAILIVTQAVDKASSAFVAFLDKTEKIRNHITTISGYWDKFHGDIDSVSDALTKFKFVLNNTIKGIISSAPTSMTKNLTDTFNGLKSIIHIIVSAFQALISIFVPTKSGLKSVGEFILSITGFLGRLFTALDNLITHLGVFNAIAKVLGSFTRGTGTILQSMADGIGAILSKLADGTGVTALQKFVQGIVSVNKITEKVENAFKRLSYVVSAALARLKEDFQGGGSTNGLMSIFTVFVFAMGYLSRKLQVVANRWKDLLGAKDAKGRLVGYRRLMQVTFDEINNTLVQVGKTMETYQQRLKADVLQKIGIAVALIAGSLLLLASIEPQKLAIALWALAGVMAMLFAFTTEFMKVFQEKKFLDFGKGIGTLSVLGMALTGIATAILILSAAVGILGRMKLETLAKGIGAVGVMLLILIGAAHMIDGVQGPLVRLGASLILFGVAINIITIAVEKLSKFSDVQVFTGLFTLASILGILAVAISKGHLADFGVRAGAGLLLMAGAIKIMASALQLMGSMDVKTIAKSLGTLAGVLLLFSLVGKALEKSTNILGIATGLVVFAVAIKVLTKSLAALGNMSLEQILNSIIALAGSLTIIAIAMSAMESNVMAATSFLIMSVGLTALATSLALLGSLSLEAIAKGLLAIVTVMLILGGVSKILSELIPYMIATAGTFNLFSVGAALLGKGLMLIAAGITALQASIIGLSAGFGAIGSAFAVLIRGILGGLSMMAIPFADTMLTMVGAGLRALLSRASEFISAGVELIVSLLEGIIANMAKIVTVVVLLITTFVNAVASNLGTIVDSGLNLIISFINALADGLRGNAEPFYAAVRNLASSTIEMFITMFQQVVDQIPIIGDDLSSKMDDLKDGIREKLAPESLEKDGYAAVNGLAKGMENGKVTDSATKVGNKAANALSKNTKFKSAGTKNAEKYANGLGRSKAALKSGMELSKKSSKGATNTKEFAKSGNKNAAAYEKKLADAKRGLKAGKTLGLGGAKGADQSGAFKSAGLNGGLGFVGGLTSPTVTNQTSSAGHEIGSIALKAAKDSLKIKSPSREFMKIGAYCGAGLAIGMRNMNGTVYEAGSNMGKRTLRGISDYTDSITEIFNSDPVIRPVLDLSEIQNGTNLINSLLGASSAYSASLSGNITNNLDAVKIVAAQNLATQKRLAVAIETLSSNNENLTTEGIYNAIRQGASDATISMTMNGRELSRGLKGLGVVFK